jgi:hypothetical protein
MARSRRALSASARAAQAHVLSDEPLLELVLASGCLSAADLAAAALVCRLWARCAACDAAWRPVWRREARSLRALEPRFARPAGAGFRAAVAQLRASALLAAEPEWRSEDFTLAVDITWRCRPLFSGLRTLDGLECDTDEVAELIVPNELAAGETDAAELVRCLVAEDASAAAAAAARVRHGLRLRVLLLRSDGAVACLADNRTCAQLDVTRAGAAPAAAVTAVQPVWVCRVGQGRDEHAFSTLDADNCAVPIDWGVTFESAPDFATSRALPTCSVQLWREMADDMAEPVQAHELLHAVTHTLRWSVPHAPTAAAAALAARAALHQASAGEEA